MSTTHSPQRGEIRGWHVATAVVAFFLVVIGVDTVFTILALRTHPGQVSVTPYEDGLRYNRQIAQLEAQERLGWRAAAAVQPGGVLVEFAGAGGAPVTGLKVSGRLQRPATEAGAIVLQFVELAPGRYEARADAAPGAWDLTAEAVASDGARFVAERRLTR